MDRPDLIYGQKIETDKMFVHENFHSYKMDPTGSVGATRAQD